MIIPVIIVQGNCDQNIDMSNLEKRKTSRKVDADVSFRLYNILSLAGEYNYLV